MAKKAVRRIHADAEYRTALAEIERYFENEPKPGTPAADRFDELALVLERYESHRWPIRNWPPRRPVAGP
jgi:HTH-type transcriptional regulator / antitoxin HigA